MKYDFLVEKRTDLNNLAFTDTQLSIIEQEFDLIPIPVMNKFFFEGWKIVAVNTDADFEGDSTNVAGQVYIPKRHLYMKKTLSDSVFRDTISHEIGHILDVCFTQGAYNFFAGSTFKSLKEQAKINTLLNTECSAWESQYSSREEFFAEAFRRYVKGRLTTEVETKKWIEGFIKSQANYYTENLQLMFESAITGVEEQPDFNQVHFLNRYGKKIAQFAFPQSTGGGGEVVNNDVLYSNNYNEASKYTDFPSTYYEIISYFSAAVNGSWGITELRTYKKGFIDQGVQAYQVKTFVFGEPNTRPLRYCRYAENNVTNGWSDWYDLKGSSSGSSGTSTDEIFFKENPETSRIKVLIVDETEEPAVNESYNADLISIVTSSTASTINISLVGSGAVNVVCNGTTVTKTLTSASQSVAIALNTSSGSNLITISNPANVHEIHCPELSINKIILNKVTNLKKLVAYKNNLQELDCTQAINIQYVHIHENPMILNKTKCIELITSLPDRNNKAWGSLIFGDKSTYKSVEYLAIYKDWYFGSTIQYIPAEWAKCHYAIRQSGVADIWESADYGEGVTIGIVDKGFDLDLTEIDYTKLKGKFNFTNQGAENEVPLPQTGLDNYHGNKHLSVMCGNGKTTVYAPAFKSNFYLLKVFDNSSNVLLADENKLYAKLNTMNDIDILSVAYGYIERNTQEDAIHAKGWIDPMTDDTSYLERYGVYIGYSAGNDNEGQTNTVLPAPYPRALRNVSAIGACGGYKPANWIDYFAASITPNASSTCFKGVDFISYSPQYCEYKRGVFDQFGGTSCAGPFSNALAALVFNLLRKKYNRKPKAEEVRNCMSRRTIDSYQGTPTEKVGTGRLSLMSYNENVRTIEHLN